MVLFGTYNQKQFAFSRVCMPNETKNHPVLCLIYMVANIYIKRHLITAYKWRDVVLCSIRYQQPLLTTMQDQTADLNIDAYNPDDFLIEANTILENRFTVPQQSLPIRLFKYLMILFGSIWGVPWMQTAAEAVREIGIESKFVQVLARIGIVLTVGIDGVWVMGTMHRVLFPIYKTKLKMRLVFDKRVWILGVSIVLAILSCIPGVYAAYLFNSDEQKYFAIITFFGNLGLAALGFYSIVFETFKRILHRKDQPSSIIFQSRLHSLFYSHIRSQSDPKSPIIPKHINNYVEFFNYLQAEAKQHAPVSTSTFHMSLILIVPLIFGTVVASSQSLIDVVLTSDFFQNELKWSVGIAIALAIIFALPNLFVSFLSSKEVIGKVMSTFLCQPSSKYNYLEYFRPHLLYLINFIAFLVCLLAPTAACYIVYTTLKKVNLAVAQASAVSIFLARVCFSNYTSRVLFTKVAIDMSKQPRPIEESAVLEVFSLMERVNPSYYLQLQPLNKQ